MFAERAGDRQQDEQKKNRRRKWESARPGRTSHLERGGGERAGERAHYWLYREIEGLNENVLWPDRGSLLFMYVNPSAECLLGQLGIRREREREGGRDGPQRPSTSMALISKCTGARATLLSEKKTSIAGTKDAGFVFSRSYFFLPGWNNFFAADERLAFGEISVRVCGGA